MNYRRALFIVDPGRDAARPLAVLRRVAPRLEHLLLIVPVPAPLFARTSGTRAAKPGAAASLETLRETATGAASHIDVQLAPELGRAALFARCVAEDIDLLVFGSRSLRSASVVSAQRGRLPVAVLWADGRPAAGPIKNLACVALDARSRAAIEAFLRDHADAGMHIAVLSPRAVAPDVLSAARQVSGVAATVEVSSPLDAPSPWRWLEDWTRTRTIDLLVFARLPTAMLMGSSRSVPALLVAPVPTLRPFKRGPIDVADLLDDGGPLRVRVDQFATAGRPSALPDQTLAFVAGGHLVATVATRDGDAELPAGLGATSLGVYRVEANGNADHVALVEERVVVVRRGQLPLILFDAEIPSPMLQVVARSTAASAADSLAVRVRPTRSCRSIRERLRAAGLSPAVLDARAVLDEGEALDVSDTLDPVRLARVAARLQRAGFPVAAVVHQGPVAPAVKGFVAVGPSEIALDDSALDDAIASWSVRSPQPVNTPDSAVVEGNRIEIEIDNEKARGWLLDVIGHSAKTVHVQLYMALDDDVGRPVEAALASAGARGVAVRVLVDSLHGLHGSFGTENPLLARLAERPGVELRVVQPITELPSLTDLKQRDHRKLVVVDGRVALVGGRNLSHEYYTAFTEAVLTPESMWREVPWLDAGARVEGPAVAGFERTFLEAWCEAGGAAFAIAAPPVAGTTSARLVVHRGLRDANTLEAYRDLIESATSHIHVVNGFPLVLELQHVLLHALRRGLRVRALIGHVTPTHAGQPFGGTWGSARTAATALVHSRMDPIIAAGGEVFLFARRDLPGWAPGLGVVHPHVHAKALSVDGCRCAVGSANLDITASYWESELLLVVEDAASARAFEAQIDALIATSTRVAHDDPAWQQLARRRAWMRHWPGVLSV